MALIKSCLASGGAFSKFTITTTGSSANITGVYDEGSGVTVSKDVNATTSPNFGLISVGYISGGTFNLTITEDCHVCGYNADGSIRDVDMHANDVITFSNATGSTQYFAYK